MSTARRGDHSPADDPFRDVAEAPTGAGLAHRERLYRALAQNVPGGALFLFDQELRYLLAEGPTLRVIGLSSEMLEGRTIFEALPAGTARALEPHYRAAVEGRTSTFETTYGGRVYLVRTSPARDERGQVFGGLAIAQDITEQKRAEAELAQALDRERASRERFATIFESIGEAFLAVDREWRITFANREAERTLGRSRDEILGRKLWDALPESIGSAFRREYELAMTERRPTRFEARLPEREVWIEVRVYPTPDGLLLYLPEVTARREMEEALRRSEQRLRTTLDALPIGVWITDETGRLIYGNPAGREVWGGALYVRPERFGEYRGWWRDTGKRIEAHEWGMARALSRREVSINEEIEIEAFDGTRKIILHSALPLIGPDGVLYGAVVVNEDVTERARIEEERARLLEGEREARAEAELRAREEAALREATEAVSASFTVEEVIRQIAGNALAATAADGAFVEQVDLERDEITVVATAGTITPPVGAVSRYSGSLGQAALEHGGPLLIPGPEFARRPREHVAARYCHDCTMAVVPLQDGGEAIGALLLLRTPDHKPFGRADLARARTFGDLAALAFRKVRLLEESERRREELERAMESRARLVRGFSHDLKNPLGAAQGHAQLLAEGIHGELRPDQQESVERIRRSLRAALDLIDDLLEFERLEAGRMRIERQPVDVRSVAWEVVEEYRATAATAGLSLEVDLPDELPMTHSDPGRIRQVLGNLVSNAVKYTQAGGRVAVRVSVRADEEAPRPGQWIAVAVSDTGPGIPEEKREEIFQEFTRLRPGKERGAGLGLAISRRIARLLGGDITVKSEVGRGSTFTLWLPL